MKTWDYLKEYNNHRTDILRIIDTVFKSGNLILGPSVKEFEENFAQYLNVKFAIGVNSGTDALLIALKTLGIGYGDEVITVANTAVPTISAIVTAGATPRFVDIEPETYLMNPDLIESTITDNTKCILPVDLYGQCANITSIKSIANRYGLRVLQDCAQSTGATHYNQLSGSLSEISAFSFYPTKNLGAYGDGGMVIIPENQLLAERARKLRTYGMTDKYYSEYHGYNSRLDSIQAAILNYKLTFLPEHLAKRKILASNYTQNLSDLDLVLPLEAEGNEHSYHLYVVRHPQRDKIIQQLGEKNINLKINYPHPIHLMPAYNHLGYKVGDLPVTEKISKEIFSLPMYPTMSEQEQNIICKSLREVIFQD